MPPSRGNRLARNVFAAGLSCLGLLACAARGVADDPQATGIPKAIELWPDGAPGANGNTDEDKPAVYPFLPLGGKGNGAAVLVIPGGGFMTRCMDQEGVLVAQWLRDRGITAFMLRYRIRPLYTMRDTVRDAHRAVQYIRANAEKYHLSPDRIGAIGFSAGGELAATASPNPPAGKPDAADPLDRVSGRLNFQILVYGSAALPRAVGNQPAPAGDAAPTAGTPPTGGAAAPSAGASPPTFMFCTAEDASHLRGMVDLYAQLRAARVPVEAHFFEQGEHGVSLAQGDPVLGTWPDQMYNWIKGSGFLTDEKRVALKGIIKIDGELFPHGYVTFTPIDNPHIPPVTAYVFNTGPVRGQYAARAERGPVPGKYKVTVYQDAVRWMSNSRDPLILSMQGKQRSGTLTDADRKEWQEYVRKRDLSPTIEGLRSYRRAKPTDDTDMTVEVKPGGEFRFDIDVVSK